MSGFLAGSGYSLLTVVAALLALLLRAYPNQRAIIWQLVGTS